MAPSNHMPDYAIFAVLFVGCLVEALLLWNNPTYTVRGLILVLPGSPVYFLRRRKEGRSS